VRDVAVSMAVSAKLAHGKIGRSASEEVVLQLISTKCMPILHAIWSRGFLIVQLSINRFLMKLFRTSNMHVVSDCQEQFNFVLPSVQLARRAKKFAKKLHAD